MFKHLMYFTSTNDLYVRRQVGDVFVTRFYRPTASSVDRVWNLFQGWPYAKFTNGDFFGQTVEVSRYAYNSW